MKIPTFPKQFDLSKTTKFELNGESLKFIEVIHFNNSKGEYKLFEYEDEIYVIFIDGNKTYVCLSKKLIKDIDYLEYKTPINANKLYPELNFVFEESLS